MRPVVFVSSALAGLATSRTPCPKPQILVRARGRGAPSLR